MIGDFFSTIEGAAVQGQDARRTEREYVVQVIHPSGGHWHDVKAGAYDRTDRQSALRHALSLRLRRSGSNYRVILRTTETTEQYIG